MKDKVVSGIRPTGFLHLGNYFGALQNFVKMQATHNCYFFVADWHSLTTHPDSSALKKSVHRVMAEYIACGLDPDKSTIYVQSDVPAIAELYLYLNTLAYKGELEKTTSFKDKARTQPQNINVGLLTYPVLQAADILIHRANLVPVGKDQEQHLEMARNFAERFNHRYGNIFPLPSAFNFGQQLVKIGGLDGIGKMSKSENQFATIYLHDDDNLIRKKISRAKTDAGPNTLNAEKPDYIENLFTLLRLTSTHEIVAKFELDFAECKIQYGALKKQLAEDLIRFITPIRTKALDIENNPAYLKEILAKGAFKANDSAMKTIQMVRKKILGG